MSRSPAKRCGSFFAIGWRRTRCRAFTSFAKICRDPPREKFCGSKWDEFCRRRFMRPHMRFGILVIAAMAIAGCHKPSPPLPTYQWVDDATAVRTLAERSRSIRTVQGTCGLTLTKPDGQSVAL